MLAALSAVAATALQLPSAHPYQWTASASSSATSRAPLARVTATRCVYCASSQHDQSPQIVAAQTSTTLPSSPIGRGGRPWGDLVFANGERTVAIGTFRRDPRIAVSIQD